MTTVYASLRDLSIAEFDTGFGLPNIYRKRSTPMDDTTQLPGVLAQALIAGVTLVVSPTPQWPVVVALGTGQDFNGGDANADTFVPWLGNVYGGNASSTPDSILDGGSA